MSLHVPEKYRVTSGRMGSDSTYGNNGAFFVPRNGENSPLKVIASDGMGLPEGRRWEHVSVSLPGRPPSWEEMCRVKDLFWDPEDVVVQYHPAEADYVSDHPNCLHLWRALDQHIPVPDPLLVGLGRKFNTGDGNQNE